MIEDFGKCYADNMKKLTFDAVTSRQLDESYGTYAKGTYIPRVKNTCCATCCSSVWQKDRWFCTKLSTFTKTDENCYMWEAKDNWKN